MFSLTKNESTWSQGTKPFYAQVAYNTEAAIFFSVQVHYFCYLKKNIFFHISGFITVFLKLLAFHCTSRLEINLVQLVVGLQIMLKVISS